MFFGSIVTTSDLVGLPKKKTTTTTTKQQQNSNKKQKTKMSKFSRPDRSHFFPYRRGETYPQQMTMNFRKLNVGAATIAILLRMTARVYHVFRVCMYFCESGIELWQVDACRKYLRHYHINTRPDCSANEFRVAVARYATLAMRSLVYAVSILCVPINYRHFDQTLEVDEAETIRNFCKHVREADSPRLCMRLCVYASPPSSFCYSFLAVDPNTPKHSLSCC